MDIKEKIAIINRIKLVFNGLNNRKISQILNTSAVSVGRWFNNNAIPPYTILVKIANYGNVTLDWLLTGKEAMMLREERVLYEPCANLIICSEEELKDRLQQLEFEERHISIPLISDHTAAADCFKINEKNIEGFAVIYQKWLQPGHIYRCIRIKGDSMSPILEDGFIVAIDCSVNQPHQLHKKMVAARYEGGITIKWLLMNDRNLILLPQNTKEHKPITIPISRPNVIIGKIACWWGKAKD